MGVKLGKMGRSWEAGSLHEFKVWKGQVGQESNLQPAVVEHAARCPETSKDIQNALESTNSAIKLSNGVQRHLTAMESVL
jgi:hypothetical protein